MLPAFDIGTDLKDFLVYSAYYDDDIDIYHPNWAVLTLSWMFAPFGIHIASSSVGFWQKSCKLAWWAHIACDPCSALQNALWVFLKVETIQREVAKPGMFESYYESGPQSVSQLVISFSPGCKYFNISPKPFGLSRSRVVWYGYYFAGQFPSSIIAGIVVSVLNFSWGVYCYLSIALMMKNQNKINQNRKRNCQRQWVKDFLCVRQIRKVVPLTTPPWSNLLLPLLGSFL